ncbi:uncharacterized protein LOC113467702 [Diaphorina citri]|uniref:Uncharacterized protein LOC113467702 n=1 Tax=Diaphorina citri TaxID=121845 RepID=A0A3Q0IYU1_DIACI|nr:uncharacterized protein LOC113467702 [Diaphorina citri]
MNSLDLTILLLISTTHAAPLGGKSSQKRKYSVTILNDSSVGDFIGTVHTWLAIRSPDKETTYFSFSHVKGATWKVVPGESSHAVKVGRDEDGGMTYVGRAWHEEDLVPAKVAPTHQGAFVAHSGLEHSKFDYEVFTIEGSRVAWQKPSTDEVVPPNALVVGHTRYGEPLYAGRALHEGFLVLGKVNAVFDIFV